MIDDPRWRDWPVIRDLYRQWRKARGAQLLPAARPFSRDWQKLLADAGLDSAIAQADAARDVKVLGIAGLLLPKAPRYYPDRIERIVIPLEAEPRWRALFGDADAAALRDAAVGVVQDFAGRAHPLLPARWREWCEGLIVCLRAGRHIRPLDFCDADQLRITLDTLFALTAREWTPRTPVRTASVELGLPSKALEERQTVLDRALTQLFGREATLDDLGIISATPLLLASGPLVVHFSNGSLADFRTLRGPFGVSEHDLERAMHIATTAVRLLTIENVKTTFPQFAARNSLGDTLIVAAGYATTTVSHFLRKLPRELPHFHFGDTDPYGFQILRSLREASPRIVTPFLMEYRPLTDSPPLDAKSRRILENLIPDPYMADCAAALRAMFDAQRKGDFEQESHGPPDLDGWPFFSNFRP